MAHCRPLSTTALILGAALAAASVGAAPIERQETVRAGRVRSVAVENLVGSVQVLPADGEELSVEFTVVAGGDEAAALAASVRFVTRQDGDRLSIEVDYPTRDHRSFRYQPPRGRFESHTEYRGERVRVSSRHGVELHVDAVARVPKGAVLRFANHVGALSAERVVGDLDLDTGSGAVRAAGNRGALRVDTGSGRVEVSHHHGQVSVDTGSGGVDLVAVRGDVAADTGSGRVTLRDVQSDRIRIDTGSGGVEIEDSRGSLECDTGSGGVRARNFTAGERVVADTGSGGVHLEGDLSAVRELRIDTGSGGASLVSGTPLDLTLHIEVGSGAIEVDVPGMREVRDDDRDRFDAVLGKGRGRAVIETGSGGARVRVGGD